MSLAVPNRQRPFTDVRDAAGAVDATATSARAGSPNALAVVSGGNIDVSKFATLAGACDQ